MSGTGEVVGREYVAWVEMVPLTVAKGWARTFGMRPTLGALKCLVYSGRLWPLMAGYGMEPCPHGFCVARARRGLGVSGGGPPRCSIPDSAEACACKAPVVSGPGWCYLDGVEPRDRRTAAALLGQDPTAGDILAYVPEHSSGVFWDGGPAAHAHSLGRYSLVDLPSEVLVGRPATCRALGFGHLASEYCDACHITGQPVPRVGPLGAACGVGAAGALGQTQSREDKRDMSNHDGEHDALWCRKGGGISRCAVEFPENVLGSVRVCSCAAPNPRASAPPMRMQEAVGAVPGSVLDAAGAWRRLEVVAPVSWTSVFRPGEVVYAGAAYIKCTRVTVVHVSGRGGLLVHSRRDWFSVRSHSRATDTRMRHMRFNVGGFTHWKVLDKAEPDVVWRPRVVSEIREASSLGQVGEDEEGLGPRFKFAKPPDGGMLGASMEGAMHGYIVRAGENLVSLSSLVVANHRTAWVYQGGERTCSLSVRELFPRGTVSGPSADVFSLEDDYTLDDGGPSSGESECSAGDCAGGFQ